MTLRSRFNHSIATAFVLVLLSAVALFAQAPAAPTNVHVNAALVSSAVNPISAARLPAGSTVLPNPTWATAGYPIPSNYTRCGSLISAYTGTAGTINTAIQNCTAGHYVELDAGTFNLSSGITLDKTGVALRGAGPNSTFLIFTGGCSGGGGIGGAICVDGDAFIDAFAGLLADNATWSSGYAQGTSTIVLSAKTNMVVGTTLLLLQSNDTTDQWPETTICEVITTCSLHNAGGTYLDARQQRQWVTVTSIEAGSCAPSCDIGISPPILGGNWRSGKSPVATWAANAVPQSGIGIEYLSIDASASGQGQSILITGTNGVWVRGIRSVKPVSMHIKTFSAIHTTIQDSYFFCWSTCGSDPAGENYGIDLYHSDSFLVQNNIFQRLSTGINTEEGTNGNVVAYNFSWDNDFTYANVDWGMRAFFTHHSDTQYLLYEGNIGSGIIFDCEHGCASHNTVFRNRWSGEDGDSAILYNKIPITLDPFSRFLNSVANVLGSSWQTIYEHTKGVTAEDPDNYNHSIYSIGYSDNMNDDVRSYDSLLRKCDWNTVTSTNDTGTNDQTGTVSDHEPTTIGEYANNVPTATCANLPASLYLSAKPAFLGSKPWPLIGPDVTSGDISGTGGHANKNPAQDCAEAIGVAVNQTTPRAFTCDYAQPLPPMVDLSSGYIDSVFVTADGTRIYFTFSILQPLDFAQGTTNYTPATDLPNHVTAPGLEWTTDLYYTELSGGAWRTPVNLGTTINTVGNECCVWVNADETEIIFYRDPVGQSGIGSLGNYTATRASRSVPWGEATPLSGSYGTTDQSATRYRHDIHKTASGDYYLWEHDTASSTYAYLLYGHWNGSSYDAPATISGTDDATKDDVQPWVSADELTLLFARRDPVTGATTLQRSTRATTGDAWGSPSTVTTTGFADGNGLTVWGEPTFDALEHAMRVLRFNTTATGWKSDILHSVGTPGTSFETPHVLNP